MKYCFTSAFTLLIISNLYCQRIPIESFMSLVSKQITIIDDTLSQKFGAQLQELSEAKDLFAWKKGFNGDHSLNNQLIVYKITDSTYEFWYDFVTNLKDWPSTNTYYESYQYELNDSKYKRLEDSIEDYWSHKAIVKNFRFENFIIKFGKIAATNQSMIKVIRNL